MDALYCYILSLLPCQDWVICAPVLSGNLAELLKLLLLSILHFGSEMPIFKIREKNALQKSVFHLGEIVSVILSNKF